MTLSEIERFSLCPGATEFLSSPTIWGYIGNTMFPLCYFRKPKAISKELWGEFISKLEMKVKGIE
jgi:hypothetical protein